MIGTITIIEDINFKRNIVYFNINDSYSIYYTRPVLVDNISR